MTTSIAQDLRRDRSKARYLASLALPLATTGFLLAPAHRGWVALGWLAGLVVIAISDEVLPPLTGRVSPDAWSLARLADAVALVQIANFALFAWRVPSWGTSIDLGLAVVMVGVGSAFSSMIAAHELIHRRPGVAHVVGRALLATVLYFFTDHLRGHHRNVGTPDDVLTARTDESFVRYLARSWPGEVRSAWNIEARRHPWWRNEVVRGVVAEMILLAVVAGHGGVLGVGTVIGQAALAHLLVAAVNFVEHWGIVRDGARSGTSDAWDSSAALSHYALLGLSFHADHHVSAARSFDRLELREESPKLPYGYFKMVAMVLFRNDETRRLLARELARRAKRDRSPD
jgi:alkane 1-monooxygenase